MDEERNDFGRWWIWITFLFIFSFVALGAMNYLGIVGQTIVEREVFEQSYQYSEARRAEIATYEAQLAELEILLKAESDAQAAENTKAQMAAIRVRIAAAKDGAE